jgi:prepilin-type processing-associated H-X9-DG protein
MGMACTDGIGRVAAAMGGGSAASQFPACRGVSFGGVLCALPALVENGLFEHLGKLPTLPAGYYHILHIVILLTSMALCRIRTVEQLRHQPPGELGKLLGLDRIPEVRTLREKLGHLGGDEAAVAAWAAAMAEHWMQADPEAAGVLYVDGHVRVYHGKVAQLPKRYVSRQKLCLRGTSDYWVNDQIGQPYFVVSREFNDGMAQVLREEIVPRLLEQVPHQPTSGELAADSKRHRFILIFDREASSPAFFQEMFKQHRVACVSYRKQPLEGWDPSEFRECEVKMPGGQTLSMKLAERGVRLANGLWVQETRKLCLSGHQVSLMSTAYRLTMEQAAVLLFSRWAQENFFKYMMEHFAIDALSERGAQEVDATREVMNPGWKQEDAQVRSLRQQITRRQSQYAAAELDGQLRTADVLRFQQGQMQLAEQIGGTGKATGRGEGTPGENASADRAIGVAAGAPDQASGTWPQAVARYDQDDCLPCGDGLVRPVARGTGSSGGRPAAGAGVVSSGGGLVPGAGAGAAAGGDSSYDQSAGRPRGRQAPGETQHSTMPVPWHEPDTSLRAGVNVIAARSGGLRPLRSSCK